MEQIKLNEKTDAELALMLAGEYETLIMVQANLRAIRQELDGRNAKNNKDTPEL